jgi:hypothetical protein
MFERLLIVDHLFMLFILQSCIIVYISKLTLLVHTFN